LAYLRPTPISLSSSLSPLLTLSQGQLTQAAVKTAKEQKQNPLLAKAFTNTLGSLADPTNLDQSLRSALSDLPVQEVLKWITDSSQSLADVQSIASPAGGLAGNKLRPNRAWGPAAAAQQQAAAAAPSPMTTKAAPSASTTTTTTQQKTQPSKEAQGGQKGAATTTAAGKQGKEEKGGNPQQGQGGRRGRRGGRGRK
jgi:hypothetical protein